MHQDHDQDQGAAYVSARVDQLGAAARERDSAGVDAIIAGLIADDHPAARRIIADALRLYDARHGSDTPADIDHS